MADRTFDKLNEEKLKDFLKINPDQATLLGLHEPYDWQLPHGGVKRYEDTLKLLETWHEDAAAMPKNSELTEEQLLCLKALKCSIDLLRFSIEEFPHWRMNPDALEIPGSLLFVMITRDYAPYDQRASAMASRLGRFPQYLEEFRGRFKESPPVRVWTDMAIESAEQFPGFLSLVEKSSMHRVSESLIEDIGGHVKTCQRALKEHVEWLKQIREVSTEKYAMGKRNFTKMIKMRGIGLAPDKMLALGQKYLRDFKKERARVAEKLAPGKGVEGAAEVVRANCPKTFEAALKATEDVMNHAKKFIIDKDLATVYPEAVLGVVETPAFLAPLLPYAALFPPSIFDKTQQGTYVVTRPKDPKDLGSHLNQASIVNTAVHEAYPGHFLQGVASNKKHWMLQMAASGGSDTIAFATETIEGWAHYCEKMMFDHGFEANDAAEFEMLNGAIWRACRIIADIKLAQGETTIDEMVEWMTKETGMARYAMEGEVKRYSHTPGQALSYMIGRHLMLEFRRELETELASRFDEKKFHDAILGYGGLPFNLLKEAVRAELAL